MYRGFNLKVENSKFKSHYDNGLKLHDTNKNAIDSEIKSFSDKEGNLIGKKISADWFPSISRNVFVSHSHKDSELAIGFSGWLHSTFGLTSFIDSCVWGYAGDLIQKIDNEYCWSNEKKEYYNYNKRNKSTSHVYMMLSVALAKMLNDCECVIFLNTPNSISTQEYIGEKTTLSPWIYSEIAMTSLIQKRDPKEHRARILAKSLVLDSISEDFGIRHEMDLDHLSDLSLSHLQQWEKQYTSPKGAGALDLLYKIKPPKERG